MRNHIRSIWRSVLYVLIAIPLFACSAAGAGSSAVQQGILQLDKGIVKIQDAKGNLQPLASASTFDLVGTLESIEPWKVSGRPLERNEATQIAEGLKVGDQVRVRGAVLPDGNWLAYSIEPAKQETNQTNQTVSMIGQVTSVNPWVVNGLPLNVTSDTVINGDIKPGTLVRVDVLLLEDGTWDVLSITPLGDMPSASGCATVVATVSSVNGNQVQFEGWPTPVTVQTSSTGTTTPASNSGVDLATLKPGQQVTAVVCLQNGQVTITQINPLNNENENEADNGQKVLICHKTGKKGQHTISVASAAVNAHLGHGDTLGACP
jgi:hypothetical protein